MINELSEKIWFGNKPEIVERRVGFGKPNKYRVYRNVVLEHCRNHST